MTLEKGHLKSSSFNRAEMPEGASSVLDKRTLETSNSNLLEVLKVGQKVLDIGCGPGAITSGICKYVGKQGTVYGVDRSRDLIDLAERNFNQVPNLVFDCSDILDYESEIKFDVITSSRTFQWMANSNAVLSKIISLLNTNGVLCILDYNHTLIEWRPSPPKSMRNFYKKFLTWRSESGMDNAIGDNISSLLRSQNMRIISTSDQSEFYHREMLNFQSQISIWSKVAELRGPQLVNDGFLSEEERQIVITDYNHWCKTRAISMKLSLKATHASLA